MLLDNCTFCVGDPEGGEGGGGGRLLLVTFIPSLYLAISSMIVVIRVSRLDDRDLGCQMGMRFLELLDGVLGKLEYILG